MGARTDETRLRDIPQGMEAAGKAALQRYFKERSEKERSVRYARIKRSDSMFAPMRAAASSWPGAAAARRNLFDSRREEKRARPQRPPAKSKILAATRAAQLTGFDWITESITFQPPFQAFTFDEELGAAGFTDAPVALGAFGELELFLDPGVAGRGDSIQTAGVLAEMRVPAKWGFVRFDASPGYIWSAEWSSAWWVEAGGNLEIGLVVNQFDQHGNFIKMVAEVFNPLVSFDDTSFNDGQYLSGLSPGADITTGWFENLTVGDQDRIYHCFAFVAANASADWAALGSMALVSAGVGFDFMTGGLLIVPQI